MASQFQLGVSYCTGRGVEKDLGEAARWYEAAAASGHALAQHNLGIMLTKGMGVEQDVDRGAELVRRERPAACRNLNSLEKNSRR